MFDNRSRHATLTSPKHTYRPILSCLGVMSSCLACLGLHFMFLGGREDDAIHGYNFASFCGWLDRLPFRDTSWHVQHLNMLILKTCSRIVDMVDGTRCHLVNSSVNIVSCPFPSLNVELVSLTTSRTQYRATLLNG